MISNYTIEIRIILIILFTSVLSISCHRKPSEQVQNDRPVDLVYPFLDTSNSRWFFFSSACRPFGMVNLSPDTQTSGAWGSGYRYDNDTIRGFSHIHAWQLAGVSVLPVTVMGDSVDYLFDDYSSVFDHKEEIVKPGYHSVLLNRYNIKAELTSTARVGFHRYVFPEKSDHAVMFNLAGRLGPSEIANGNIEKISDNELSGKITNLPTIRRPKPTEVFFYVLFDSEIKDIYYKNDVKDVSKALVILNSERDTVKMKVGISYTSVSGAKKNASFELPHWDFDRVVNDSQEEWNDLLSRIYVEGASLQDRRRFYTDLWHALQGRRTISDADGSYADYTGEKMTVRQIPLNDSGQPKFRHFNSDSFWGAQWTLNTLWHLIYPEISEEFINSLLLYYKDGGLIPRGPSGGNYTFVMTGATTTPFIVSAYQKGIRGFDVDLAYEGMKKNHMPGGLMSKAGYEHKTSQGGGLEYYIEKGYVPWPLPEGEFGFHQDGPSLTLEYAYQDWTLAQLAKAFRKDDDYNYLISRSYNYKNVYDSVSGWMRPKDAEGNWKQPYDPYEYDAGFNESNGAQATWFVPHDIEGLAALMGSREKAVDKLNNAFVEAEKLGFTSGTSHSQERHPEYRRIPINYGNQPSIQTAFIFNQLGRPDLTQYWSRRVIKAAYSDLSPAKGYNGDEDQGLMGSLAVLMKTGLFQLNGGTEQDPVYEIGSPIFDKVVFKLNPDYYPGGKFTINTINNAENNCYVKSVHLNDQPLNRYTIHHSEIINGGELSLHMEKSLDKVGLEGMTQ